MELKYDYAGNTPSLNARPRATVSPWKPACPSSRSKNQKKNVDMRVGGGGGRGGSAVGKITAHFAEHEIWHFATATQDISSSDFYATVYLVGSSGSFMVASSKPTVGNWRAKAATSARSCLSSGSASRSPLRCFLKSASFLPVLSLMD